MSTIDISHHLLSSARRKAFAGYDPFDSLNSEVLRNTSLKKSELVRLVWIQLGKRSPVNMRSILKVPEKRNPKGVALFILGLLEDYARTGNGEYLTEAIDLGDWLLDERSNREEWRYSCWGYHFDWQARAFFVPAGKPNVITTVYVSRALRELGDVASKVRFIEAALESAYFISKFLHTETDDGDFYAYIPGENTFVHNASLWGAAWCVEAGLLLGREEIVSQALEVARYSVAHQREDGAWVYGSRHHHQFIDGFHTGYNLEALNRIGILLGSDEFKSNISKGLDFYKENFFTEDGTAKYYHNKAYPLDYHNVAQALITLLTVGGASELALCNKVIDRAISTLYLPKSHQFVYQKTRWFTNAINYTRWTQAWAYYSLAFYNRYREELSDHAKD
ncbi:aspartate-semialdehyde dehydrogenase, partial [Pontibacterium sp.]|uniref:aspartate-semialdehyde dehydrogenase n=1 Tax=Pontibacterium sp. TaxID=2036026 RepID=UPI003563AF14